MLPKGVQAFTREPRLRLGQPGHHRRGRPDRARPRRRRHRRRRRVAVERADPALARDVATRSSPRRRAKSLGGRVKALARDSPARPRADHARHRRAVDRRDDGRVGREDGEDQRTSRARSRTSSRCARIDSPPPAPQDGRLTAEIVPVYVPPSFESDARRDNGIRDDTSDRAARARSSRCSIEVRHVTAGNSSPLTDGGGARAAHERGASAKALGYSRSASSDRTRTPRSIPGEQLLQAPVLAAPVALERAGLTLARHRPRRDARGVRRAGAVATCRGFESQRVGGARRVLAAGRRGRPRAAQRDGRIDRDRPPVRRDRRRASLTTLLQRARAARRTVRADDRVRRRRDGASRWSWSAHDRPRIADALATRDRRRRRGHHDRPARRAGEHVRPRASRTSSRRCSTGSSATSDRCSGRADQRQARQLHRRRRHRGVPRDRDAADAERAEPRRPGAARRGSSGCGCRSSPRSTARASAAGSRSRSRAATASRPTIRRRCSGCPRCSSASFPAPAARSGCRGSIGLAARARHDPHRPERPREEGAADRPRRRAGASGDPARGRGASARASSPTARSKRRRAPKGRGATGMLLEENPIGPRDRVQEGAREA